MSINEVTEFSDSTWLNITLAYLISGDGRYAEFKYGVLDKETNLVRIGEYDYPVDTYRACVDFFEAIPFTDYERLLNQYKCKSKKELIEVIAYKVFNNND